MSPRRHRRHVERILVIKPSSMGDIFHVFPAVKLLRERYPNAKLDWMVHPAFADLLVYSPFPVRRIILFDRQKLSKISSFSTEFRNLVAGLRFHHYDLVIDFQGLMRSAFFAAMTRGSRPKGFSKPREPLAKLFYGEHFPVDPSLHAIERNVELVNQILETNSPVPENAWTKTDRFRQVLPEDFRNNVPVVALIPGARWESKCFPVQLFAEVVRKIAAENPVARFVIVGSGSERKDGKKLLEALAFLGDRITSLVGATSVGEMVRLLSECALIIGNDSGPGHAAALTGVPVITFFGPTDPQLTGPYWKQCKVFQADVPCKNCLKRKCPAGNPPECHNLPVDQIASAALDLLAAGVKKETEQ